MLGLAFAFALQAADAGSAPAQTILCGVVSELNWTKPNATIDLEVFKATNGAPTGRWKVKGTSPNTMLRSGITRDSLKTGTLVLVQADWDGKPCADLCLGQARDWRFPNNGIFLGVGSSGSQPPPSAPTAASCDNIPKSRGFP